MSHEPPVPVIFTIGHSNHNLERFLGLLEGFEIETLVDIRSNPYSRFSPHFNQPALRAAVEGPGCSTYTWVTGSGGNRPTRP